MIVQETELRGCYILEPKVFYDERGYFYESYNQKRIEEIINQKVDFVQDNQSYSKEGVLRGLHYQEGIHAQAKLVRVLQGRVLDVAIDIRKDSSTFGMHISVELSAENRKQLFIPRGFAHGFVVLSPEATFHYKCDNFYSKEAEKGIIFDDETLKIDWKLPKKSLIVSEKDLILPTFNELVL